ncbi:hypothetical protein KIW84_012398 [Lathyrus oleraceus]|uniref:Uncharacterized protein n=1 Tax=Pisum sativum TaxID=3888 RepID=A0A9D5GW94_PEA|nr:hypothetical protein KIW84_012398 [Pisum sativum]
MVSIADVLKETRSGRVFSPISSKVMEEVLVGKNVEVHVVDPVSAPTCQSGLRIAFIPRVSISPVATAGDSAGDPVSLSESLLAFVGVTAVSNVCSLFRAVIGPKRVHRYLTKENHPRLAMDQIQKELADMRERMDQFMTLMTSMAEGQAKLKELVEQPRPDPEVEIPSAEGNPGNPRNADNPVNTGNAGNANVDGNPGNVGNTENVGNGIGPLLKIVSFDVTNLGLVQGVRIPHKFKPHTFEKYNGASCPRTHLQSYLGRLGAHTEDEKLWMYYFEDSLTGASRE